MRKLFEIFKVLHTIPKKNSSRGNYMRKYGMCTLLKRLMDFISRIRFDSSKDEQILIQILKEKLSQVLKF